MRFTIWAMHPIFIYDTVAKCVPYYNPHIIQYRFIIISALPAATIQ